MIVVDTSVWSLALRRTKSDHPVPKAARLLRGLIEDGQPVAVPGVVKQELLSGLRNPAQFERLHRVLEPFPVLLATDADHVDAARVVNTCRANGVSAGPIDALVVALTMRVDGLLLSTDADYRHVQAHVPFNLQLLGVD